MASAKKQSNLSNNHFILVMVLVSLVTVVLSVVIGRSLVSGILLNNKVIAKKVTADNQLKDNLAAVEQLRQEYDQLGGRRRLILESLPVKRDVPGLASTLELIAGTSGLKLKSITPVEAAADTAPAPPAADGNAAAPAPAASTGEDQPTPYQVALSVEGNYTSLVNFLRNLELSARPVRVTALTATGNSASMSADLQLSSYWQAEADLTPKTEVVQ
ncbi:type 4a pilus biogenesis protein PilO [Candidatus Parcubacteria bacterium]|nr:type 4a pilus biogenesis protein PilO [Candidatus Parcubacteria bacterium]